MSVQVRTVSITMRDENCMEFTQIAAVHTCAHNLVTGEADEEWPYLPPRFGSAFLAMGHTLGAVLDRTELGSTRHPRYPGEPRTSRDYFYFGATDDLPQESRFKVSASD